MSAASTQLIDEIETLLSRSESWDAVAMRDALVHTMRAQVRILKWSAKVEKSLDNVDIQSVFSDRTGAI